jgi:hypothetical protein
VTSCVTNSSQYTCPRFCVFTAILIAGIKYQHVYDRMITRIRTVGTKSSNTPQRRLHVARSSMICKRHNTQHRHTPSAGVHTFYKNRGNTSSIPAKRVTRNKLRTEDPQITGATVQNLVVMATRTPELCTSGLSVFTDTSSCQSRVKAGHRTNEFGYFVNVVKEVKW